MDNKMKQQDGTELLSLFDGIGGFPLAYARSLGVDHDSLQYASSEIEPYPMRVLARNFSKHVQLGDITTADMNGLSPDIITMGTPCTGFSISGLRDGLLNVQSKLFVNGIETVNQLRPKYFIWENVFGVLSSENGNTFKEILQHMSDIGYDAAWTMLDTQYFGIPQRRKRIYMIGFRDGFDSSSNIFRWFSRRGKNLPFYENSGDANPNSVDAQDHKCYFNWQRSDKHILKGVASTLTKRDYKQFTDIIVQNGQIRKIMPKERLRLQGIPDDFFDDVSGSTTEMYKANGMSVPVVQWVVDCLRDYDNHNEGFQMPPRYIGGTVQDAFAGKIHKHGCMQRVGAGVGLSFYDPVSDMPDTPTEGNIWDFLDPIVPSSFELSEKACKGLINRHHTGGNELPKKLLHAMICKYPNLKG